jgi:hypothetical protein
MPPWPQLSQVEQDLIICRALVDLYSHPLLAENLAFRGGTALFKLHLLPARYSEDNVITSRQNSANPNVPGFLMTLSGRSIIPPSTHDLWPEQTLPLDKLPGGSES